MKKRIIYSIGMFLVLLSTLLFNGSIFQCGNPIPYVEKIITLNEEKKFAKVYKDKEIYITKKGDNEDLHKYIQDEYKVSFLEHMGSGFIFVSSDKKVILTSEIYLKNYEVWDVKEESNFI